MVEKLTNLGNADEYWRSGGKLYRGSLEEARAVLSKLANGEKLGVRDSSLVQAENMARFSQVLITWEQKYLYVFLREMTKKTEGRSNSLLKTPGVMPPWVLTDQRLLAEVLRLTDKKKLDSFMRAYPNIW